MARRTPPRDSKGRFVSGRSGGRRKRNPSLKNMSVGGVKVYPAAYDAVGVVVGTYFGGAATNFVSRQLVGRLPANIQGVGWAAAGIGTIMLGRYLKGKMAKKLPVDYAGIGLAVPMFVEALTQFGAPGFAPAVVAPPPQVGGETVEGETTASGTIRAGGLPGSMGGSLRGGMLPGGMGGSLRGGVMPGVSSMGRSRMRMLR